MSNEVGERLQKVLAAAGFGSRRKIETWIKEGRLKINGELATLGDRVTAQDKVYLDGRLLRSAQLTKSPRKVIAYHKPEGQVCTRSDTEGRKTLFESLPKLSNGRWVTVGRLDINTSGIILCTTDGELANRLMHPSLCVDREYAVRVLGEVSDVMLKNLRSGVELEDGPARFNDIVDTGGKGANHWYHVVLQEGRKREVRRLWESQGVKVSRLIRVRYGPIILTKKLRTGKWMELDEEDVKQLLQMAGMEVEVGEEAVKSHGKPGSKSHQKRSDKKYTNNIKRKSYPGRRKTRTS